ncbi:MAG: hypothetical protein AAF551_03830, partial [Bacteroidota bacterium]
GEGRNMLTDIWEYDPLSDEWEKKDASFTGKAKLAPSTVFFEFSETKGVFGTGSGLDELPSDDLWLYDAIADKWEPLPVNLPKKISLGIGNSINGVMYIGTGQDGDFLDSATMWALRLDIPAT